MKKLLFLGACVASLVVSTSALAAVSYGEDDTLSITSPAVGATGNITSISVDASGFGTTGQMTVLVLDGTDTTTIDQNKIMYIDQAAAGTDIFQNMGLLLPENATTLPNGSYTIMVGNDQGAAIKKAVLTISEDEQKKTGTYGDVNGDGNINGTDSSLVLQKSVGIIDGFTNQKNEAIPEKVGDVNGDSNINGTDSSLILQKSVGTIDGFKDQSGVPLTTFNY